MASAIDEGRADRRRVERWIGFAHRGELQFGLALDPSENRSRSARRVSCAVARDVYEVEGLLVGPKSLEGFCCSKSKVFGDFDVFTVSLLATSRHEDSCTTVPYSALT